MAKPKIINRTKEQIRADAENAKKMEEAKREVATQRAFIKETFYPFLLKNSIDVKDCLHSLQMISSELNGTFQEKMVTMQREMSEAPLAKLGLEKRKFFSDSLTNQHADRDLKLVKLFKGHKTNVASAMIAGMVNEIKMFLDKENEGRPLTTVQADFLDEQETPAKKK